MIHVDAFEVQDVATGRFFVMQYLREPGPSRYGPDWIEDINRLDQWHKEAEIDRFLEHACRGQPDPERILWAVRIPAIFSYFYGGNYMGRWTPAEGAEITEMVVRKVRRPCCECCGANPHGRDRPRRGLQQVADGTWRCEKHVGRNPCAIEGCGKTRASKHPASDSHLCGPHWKMAPHPLKLVYRRLWRLAKRNVRRRIGDEQGWTENLSSRYWRNWYRLVEGARLAVNPPAIEAEVVSSGPPPAALLKELERIGL